MPSSVQRGVLQQNPQKLYLSFCQSLFYPVAIWCAKYQCVAFFYLVLFFVALPFCPATMLLFESTNSQMNRSDPSSPVSCSASVTSACLLFVYYFFFSFFFRSYNFGCICGFLSVNIAATLTVILLLFCSYCLCRCCSFSWLSQLMSTVQLFFVFFTHKHTHTKMLHIIPNSKEQVNNVTAPSLLNKGLNLRPNPDLKRFVVFKMNVKCKQQPDISCCL